VVLPQSEVNRVTGSTFNRAIVESLDNRITVRTIEEPRATGQAAEAIYEFSPGLELKTARYGDRYWDSHRALELAGKLDHSRERCADRDGPRLIHVWEPATGWKEIRR
jgi:hypothetical protein